MASGDVFKITLKMSLDAVQCRPGFYLVEGGGGGPGISTQVVADHVLSTLGADPLAGFIQNVKLDAVRAEDIQPGTTAWSEAYPGTPIAGDVADDNPPPPQDSMLATMYTVKKRTLGNYAAMGRIYVPGIYSTGQISGFLTTTLYNAFGLFVATLRNVYVDDGTAYQMHVVSFVPGSNPRVIRAIEPVLFFNPQNQVAIQRPRRPGRGI